MSDCSITTAIVGIVAWSRNRTVHQKPIDKDLHCLAKEASTRTIQNRFSFKVNDIYQAFPEHPDGVWIFLDVLDVLAVMPFWTGGGPAFRSIRSRVSSKCVFSSMAGP